MCALAAYVDGETFEDTRLLERSHNEHVLGMLDALIRRVRERHPRFPGFATVAFGAGPGSFTGVRIAAAMTQAIALGQGADVVRLPSLVVRVHSALAATDLAPPGERHAVGLVRSRAHAYYAQHVVCGVDGRVVASGDPVLLASLEDFQGWRSAGTAILIGERPVWLPDHMPVIASEISAAGLLRSLADPGAAYPLLPPEHALPIYIEADSPWRPN